MVSFAQFAEANINGYSLVAIKALPEVVASLLERLPDATHLERNCVIDLVVRNPTDGVLRHPDESYLEIAAYPDKRTSYLVQSQGAEWCVILRTVDWVEIDDCDWVQNVAKLLANQLNTVAISIAGDYACDLRIFEGSKLVKKKSDDLDQVAKIVGEYGIDIPDCCIAEDPPRLFATKDVADTIQVAHRLQLAVDSQRNA